MLHGQLTDPGVQFLNRLLGFLSFPNAFAKQSGRAFQQLFFPVANLVGMHIELNRPVFSGGSN